MSAEQFPRQNELNHLINLVNRHLDNVRADAIDMSEAECFTLYGSHSNALRAALDSGLKITLLQAAGKKPEGLLDISEDATRPRVIPMVPEAGERRVSAPPRITEQVEDPQPARRVLNVLVNAGDMDKAIGEFMRSAKSYPNRSEARTQIAEFALIAKILGIYNP